MSNKEDNKGVTKDVKEENYFNGSGHHQLKHNLNKYKNVEYQERSCLSPMELQVNSDDISKDEIGKRPKRNDSSLDVSKRSSSARKNRRAKLQNKKRSVPAYASSTTISTVLGDISKETDIDWSINETVSDKDDKLATDWEIRLEPPTPNNISYRQYVEQKSDKKFTTYDIEDKDEEEYEDIKKYHDAPVKVAIAVQKLFRVFSSLSCGLLGGVSLWQCLIIHQWSSPFSDPFLEYIPEYARPLQSLIYFLSTVSLISVLDSCKLGSLKGRNFSYCLPCKKLPLFVAALLMMTMFISLFCSPLDDQLALSAYNNRSFIDKTSPTLVGWTVESWVTLNAMRCIGGLLSWVLFSICSSPDALQNHLISLLGLLKQNGAAIKEDSPKHVHN